MILLGLGSLLFLVAAFLPYSRVFAEPSSEKKLAILTEMKTMWTIGSFLFGSGAVLAAIAFGIQSIGLKQVPGAALSYLGVILMLIGSVSWCWHLYERTVDVNAFAMGENTPYLFIVYSVLTQAGLVLIGIFFLKSDIVNWIGWMFIIGAAIFFVLMVIFKDMPPFVYYVLTLIASIVLFIKV